MVYIIVEKARTVIGRDEFCEYLVDDCGYHEVGMRSTPDHFYMVSNPNSLSGVQDNVHALSRDEKVNYGLGQVFVDGQDPHLQPNPTAPVAPSFPVPDRPR